MLPVLVTLIYLGLTALLWYARLGDLQWLAGSLVLGGAWMAWFLWHVTRR